jgi:GLPGLI family protein
MKYALILLSLFLNYNTQETFKTSKVIYKIERTKDKSRDVYGKNKEINKSLTKVNDNVAEIATDFTYTMYFNENESYYSMDEYTPDETVNDWYYSLALFVGGKGNFYQNKIKGISIRQYEDESGFIRVKDTLYKKWNITNEVSTINGIKVIKATYKDFIVWFAPEIPVPFGPMGLGGLPGLILRSSDGHFDIYASEIHLNESDHSIKEPKKGKLMTIQEKKAWDAKRMFKLSNKYR